MQNDRDNYKLSTQTDGPFEPRRATTRSSSSARTTSSSSSSDRITIWTGPGASARSQEDEQD
eukprot:1520788-Lingulodinium_polyedra.AAC.1